MSCRPIRVGLHEYSKWARINIPLIRKEGVAWSAIGCRRPMGIAKPSLRLRAATNNTSGVELSKHDWSQLTWVGQKCGRYASRVTIQWPITFYCVILTVLSLKDVKLKLLIKNNKLTPTFSFFCSLSLSNTVLLLVI